MKKKITYTQNQKELIEFPSEHEDKGFYDLPLHGISRAKRQGKTVGQQLTI